MSDWLRGKLIWLEFRLWLLARRRSPAGVQRPGSETQP